MKRVNILILLWCFCLLGMMAAPIDKSKALTAAQSFLASKRTATGGPRSAPQKLPQMTLAGEVKGLYVFNIQEDGGFVIVSNDDATIPVLGFSDSGNIDINNMPDNMKAWLQGYADEIAWYQQHGLSTATASPQAKVGNHSTNAIGPLLSTTWNQDYPYNRYSPDGCATGCVATAMAQAMYYTEKKANKVVTVTATTAEIPAYTTRTYGISMNAIPAGTTISWQDMINDYTKGYTETQGEAVARLMSLCGLSVEMDYGPSSGAFTKDVPKALKTYFGYEETTTCMSRSWYSYANWTDLIYNELQQGRPVVYAGQSVDGGHCFVCDGYKYEDGTDYFHINWGWGGQSDNYFVLSVLDPDHQGIGGSASNSAYNSGQEAVVGIQKIGGEGTVLNVDKNYFNLTFNSITVSHAKIALGESVDVTINVTNNSKDAYDGDLNLIVNNYLGKGETFLIPSGETQDCTINFTPATVGECTIRVTYPEPRPDNVGQYPSGIVTPQANMTVVDQTPTDLTAADITSETATISWTNVGEATKWNMALTPMNLMQEDFNENNPEWLAYRFGTPEPSGFEYVKTGGIDNSPCYRSPSYKDDQDLNPVVGLCTPLMNLGGMMAFYVWGAGEKFQVWEYEEGSPGFTPISDVFDASATPWVFTLDLSSYMGKRAYLAVVHLNSGGHTAESYLYVDNFTLLEPVGSTTIDGSIVNNSYRITDLTKETICQVQVQPVIHDGGNWSAPLYFQTTDNKLSLADNDSELATKNASLVEMWDGVVADVTLNGRTLYKDGAWNTLCLPFNVTLAGSQLAGADARALSSASLGDGTLTLNFSDPVTTLQAGTPYIIKWESDDNIVNPVFTDVSIDKATHDFTSEDTKVTFIGTYSPTDIYTTTKSNLYLGSDNKLYYPWGEGMTSFNINAFRAYFHLNDPTPAGVKAFVLNFGNDETTSIHNSQFIIHHADDAWYTIDGRRLSGKPTTKGIYIHSGKKRVMK